MEYVYKTGKKFEALSYRDDIEENEEMYKEIVDNLRLNQIRKKKLLQEGKPEIDFDYPRLI